MYFRVCQHCGCALDPSESCDCEQERRSEQGQEEMSKNGGNEGKWNVEEVETEE